MPTQNNDTLWYHPSVSKLLRNLSNMANNEMVLYILELFKTLEYEDFECFLEDPYQRAANYTGSGYDSNTLSPYVDIETVKSLDLPRFKDIIFRLRFKVIDRITDPIQNLIYRGDLLYKIRFIFFRDRYADKNVYLHADFRDQLDYDATDFKLMIERRYTEYTRTLRVKYKQGLRPNWST